MLIHVFKQKSEEVSRIAPNCTLFALQCQEKPSGVYKMQETAWAAGALPGLAALSPVTQPPLLVFQASGFGPRMSPATNFQTPL